MLFSLRLALVFLAVAICPAIATAEERIQFNIFNENCQTRFFAQDIAVDDYGTIYLVDAIGGVEGSDAVVERFNYNGRHAGFLLRDDPVNPDLGADAVALDRSGAGYVAASNLQFDGLYRFPRYPDSRVTPFTMLPLDAADLTVDMGGTIHAVLDNQIRRIGPAGNVIVTFDIPPGPSGPATVEEIDTDAGRNLYGADGSNRRVIVVNSDGQFRFFSDPTELPTVRGIAVRRTPLAEEILVGIDDITSPRVARFTPSGTFLGRIALDRAPQDIEVDSYGSIYVLSDFGSIHGIDPDIPAASLVEAARSVALPGLPLDGSSQGEYFKGLAVRAGRTSGNFAAVIDARRQLDALRAQAQFTESLQENPQGADRISRSLEEINGFLTAIETYSPIVVGEDCDPVTMPEPAAPIDILKDTIEFLLGAEPFYGRYRSSSPIRLPLPPRIELTLDTSTATSSFIKPGAWGGDSAVGGGLVRPQVISSNIALEIGPGGATVSSFSSEFGSMDINGTPSGVNRARLAPNGQVYSTFGVGQFGAIEFTAHAEGVITNDLYLDNRPIFTFSDLQGYVGLLGDTAAAYGTNEPMIVPGLPGGPPTELPGVAFIATRVSFNQANGRLQFQENTDPGRQPDVSVILTPSGVFAGGIGSGELVAGATFALEPLTFSGFNTSTGRFEFADSSFQILANQNVLVSGELANIGIDVQGYLFTAELVLDDLPPGLQSPFLEALTSNQSEFMLLTPAATLDLLMGSDNFNSPYQTGTQLMVMAAVIPEPQSVVLTLVMAITYFVAARIRRGRRPV
ncbi:MAG: hypothetical protein WD894_23295 [Pirellulales bacterium]